MWLTVVFWVFVAIPALNASKEIHHRKFEVDYENDVFLMNGQPFSYVSGSIHYFRVPHQYWKDRLRKIKLLGFNAITTYVEWSLHEPNRGSFNFDGDADLVKFLRLAQEENLYVILRPGPYICAEREFGGYPAWLLSENPSMKFRTSDRSHTFFVSKWFQELFKRISPLLYGNGGPIILIQVENEYGSYPTHDLDYLIWLRDLFTSYVSQKAVLFTTDGWNLEAITRGKIPGVFSTVDFGASQRNVMELFRPLRLMQPHGPLVNSEFYTGWLSYWGDPVARVDTRAVVRTMKSLLAANASFSCYMIHGGTNFGFTSGSDISTVIKLDLTSYDYDAPISEAGDLTDKYFAIRKLMKEHGMPVGNDEDVERLRVSPKGKYGRVQLEPVVSLLDSPIGIISESTMYPLPMELFNQSYGFIAYTHVIDGELYDPSVLKVDVRDRALVLLDKVEFNVLANTIINETVLPPYAKAGMNLTILVENEGRRNFKLLSDVTKGIVSNATLDRKILKNWSTVSYSLTTEDIRKIESLVGSRDERQGKINFPAFLTANFTLPPPLPDQELKNERKLQTPESPTSESDSGRGMSEGSRHHQQLDTFLDMSGWGKGVVFINGHNLGRYWHIGPQRTLYVPGVWLNSHPQTNTVTVMELHFPHPNRTVEFTPNPKFDHEQYSVKNVP